MKSEWIGQTIKKKIQKIEKKQLKSVVKLPHVNKKSLDRKRFFFKHRFLTLL